MVEFESKAFQVESIALVKFNTPQKCTTIGGVLSGRNDTHWKVLINGKTLVYFDGGLSESQWTPSANSPSPCDPYIFQNARNILIVSAQIVTDDSNCHKVCKKIFQLLGIDILTGEEIVKRQFQNATVTGSGVILSLFSTVLTGGIFGIVLFTGVALGATGGVQIMSQSDGHNGRRIV